MAHKKGMYNSMYRSEGKRGKMNPPDLDYIKKEMRMSGYGGSNPPKGEPKHNPEPKGSRYPSAKANNIAKN